jgi:hypothetical protein
MTSVNRRTEIFESVELLDITAIAYRVLVDIINQLRKSQQPRR